MFLLQDSLVAAAAGSFSEKLQLLSHSQEGDKSPVIFIQPLLSDQYLTAKCRREWLAVR